MKPIYPFTAVVGQEPLKLALLLCAIDPSLGGVLISGPRGVAKTTLARAVAELVPGRFVELPLGATEERLTGTLNLEAALGGGRVEFAPGLLANAHDGVLYVDEVNLLPDGLVDLLLDAAASGQNVVERDGISHAHPSRFVLIGSMNPEEGELRPQLIDRFGLSVHAGTEIAPPDRAAIVSRRLAFDVEPEAFRAEFAAEQEALIERCRSARKRVQSIAVDGALLQHVTEVCHAAGVEGVRADLAMLRAARALAAWEGRDAITTEHVAAVAELALAHRRPRKAPDPRGDRGGAGSAAPSGGGAPPGSAGGITALGQRGAMPRVPVRPAAPRALPSDLFTSARGRRAGALRRGKLARSTRSPGAIDWFKTLSGPRPLTRDKVRRRHRRAPLHELWIVAVDCSSSMLHHSGLALAKSVAQALRLDARRRGAQLTLLSFRGTGARREAISTAGQALLDRSILDLGGGGGTPLHEALRMVHALCRSSRFSVAGVTRRLVLLTDGRSSEEVADLSRFVPGLEAVVVDCELGRVRLGLARRLAGALGAAYFHAEALPSV
ncbi:MAG TPA: ATP-binding protein [Polyangiaceae bacterium]|nr:ATP-binding protein [Polyangiaceae bacterium]